MSKKSDISYFTCEKCGLCCKNIGSVEELRDFDSGNGVCKHLNSNNLCGIYDERPLICNVEKMYEVKYYQDFIKDEFYRANREVCLKLQNKSKLDFL